MSLLRPIIGEDISLCVAWIRTLGVIYGDASQMTQVIMNLVLNARDAMPHGGAIRIRTANKDTRGP